MLLVLFVLSINGSWTCPFSSHKYLSTCVYIGKSISEAFGSEEKAKSEAQRVFIDGANDVLSRTDMLNMSLKVKKWVIGNGRDFEGGGPNGCPTGAKDGIKKVNLKFREWVISQGDRCGIWVNLTSCHASYRAVGYSGIGKVGETGNGASIRWLHNSQMQSSPLLARLFAHEVGHLLGTRHTNAGLMQEKIPTSGGTPTFDAVARRNICKHLKQQNDRSKLAPHLSDSALTKNATPAKTAASQTTAAPTGNLSCGNHTAPNCSGCPQGHGKHWCGGDCMWLNGQCRARNYPMAPTTTAPTTTAAPTNAAPASSAAWKRNAAPTECRDSNPAVLCIWYKKKGLCTWKNAVKCRKSCGRCVR